MPLSLFLFRKNKYNPEYVYYIYGQAVPRVQLFSIQIYGLPIDTTIPLQESMELV